MRRLGCLSISGILATILTLIVIVGIGLARGGVLFNPGELNAETSGRILKGVESHAATNGNCAACHAAFWTRTTMDDLCRSCHTDILDGGNFHNIMLAQGAELTCQRCHTDHNGPQAAVTILQIERFPHNEVGFSLQAHQFHSDKSSFVCTDCHTTELAMFSEATCLNCHQDINPAYTKSHRTDFGDSCLACHDGLDTYGAQFEHSQTAFPLSGAHTGAACIACHSEAQFKGTPGECFACHAADDAHDGELGTDCAACHTSDAWESATFDHNQTAFPLSGAHTNTACEACHTTAQFKGIPGDCFACHAANDAHQGRFGNDCAACHTSENWEATDFDHALTNFPLTGAHIAAACEACHAAGYAGTPTQCAACHADPAFHLGLFVSDCAACHSAEAWRPARFDQAHLFPMNHGESGMNACSVCHPNNLNTYSCYGCHEHNPANIESEHREEGIRDFQDCTRCHPTGREEEGEHGEGDDD